MCEHRRFSAAALRRAVTEALAREGVPPHVRKVEAELMVEAELHGVPSHGLLMLPRLVAGLRGRRANPDPQVRLVRDSAAVCVMNGDRGPGRYVGVQGMRAAIERAGRFGIGACLVANTTHWGRAHAYACLAADEGFVGLCTTNAIPNMVVPGSPRPVLGNNPLAIAAPRGGGRRPIVLDIAMSQAALGRVATAEREGWDVPLGWGLDGNGQPTSDAAAILSSQNLLPMGGHKGAGLALMMEVLTAALGGSLLSHEIVGNDDSGLDAGASKLFLALDVGAFGDRARFEERVEDLLAHVRATSSGRAALAPGERGWRTRAEYERDGIPVHPVVLAALQAVGVELPD
ncbi:MAG: Ldh family oxidoreductase [Vicinamibacterales bacterium]